MSKKEDVKSFIDDVRESIQPSKFDFYETLFYLSKAVLIEGDLTETSKSEVSALIKSVAPLFVPETRSPIKHFKSKEEAINSLEVFGGVVAGSIESL